LSAAFFKALFPRRNDSGGATSSRGLRDERPSHFKLLSELSQDLLTILGKQRRKFGFCQQAETALAIRVAFQQTNLNGSGLEFIAQENAVSLRLVNIPQRIEIF
jgi:hypothetical protein